MSALRNVEDTISGFVDRIFGRMFRGYVEPVELARKLAREMEDHKTVSVSRVYVPNEYVIYLSQKDHGRFASFAASLTQELGVYVGERARHEGFTLLSKPIVRLETDTDLRLGEYGVACRVVDPPANDQHLPVAAPDAPAASTGAVMDPTFVPAPPPLRTPIAMDDVELDDIDLAGEPSDRLLPPVDAAEAVPDVAEAVDPDDLDAAGEEELPPVVATPIEIDDVDPSDEFDDERSSVPAAGAVPLPDPDEPDPFLEPAPASEPPAAPTTPTVTGPSPVPEVDVEPPPLIPDAPAIPKPPAPPPIVEPPPAPPLPEAVEPTEPEPIAEPAAAAPPPPPPHVPEAPDLPETPEAPPLPPPGGYEPLAGVSGTQILSASDARDAGLVQEEMALVLGGRRFPLTKRASTMGRSRDCDVVVPDPNASRHHAEIRHIGLDYFLVDAGSTNGTIVNGQRVRRHPLADGDTILIGTTEILVEYRS